MLIEEARKAYNELMENVKNLVTNYSVLQAAEKNYADIVEKNAKANEVQFALDKKFKKNKKSKTTTKLSVTVKKLKKGKKYFVRVRAYKKASDGSKVNGKWSDVKKIKIRK